MKRVLAPFLPCLVALGTILGLGYVLTPRMPAPAAFGIALGLACFVALLMIWWETRKHAVDPFDVDSEIPDPKSYVSAPPCPKKQPQFILAMDQAFFDGCAHFQRDLNQVAIADFLGWQETASALVLKERMVLEPDEDYRQLLPYVIVRQLGHDGQMRYLTYRRTKLVGEQRLAGMCSIGFGGHIDATSVIWNADSTLNLRDTIMASAFRELQEELAQEVDAEGRTEPLDLKPIAYPVFADLFITHNVGVQRMHLGIVMTLDVPVDLVLTTAEAELQFMGMLSLRELADLCADPEAYGNEPGERLALEVWSHLLVDYLDLQERAWPTPV